MKFYEWLKVQVKTLPLMAKKDALRQLSPLEKQRQLFAWARNGEITFPQFCALNEFLRINGDESVQVELENCGVAWRMVWTENEVGWGSKPDEVSYHLSYEDAMRDAEKAIVDLRSNAKNYYWSPDTASIKPVLLRSSAYTTLAKENKLVVDYKNSESCEI